MKSCTILCIFAVVAIFQVSFNSNSFAAPAPNITSLTVVQVCSEYECIDTTVNPYNVSILGGSQLKVYVLQMGYGSQTAKYNNIAVYSNSSQTITQSGIVVGFLDTYDFNTSKTASFNVTARSANNYNDVWSASIYIVMNPFLTISKSGSGSGTITADSGTISWNGNSGSANYPSDTVLTLMATPNSGSSFDGWSSDCTVNADGNCEIIVNSNKSVSATFSVIPNTRIGTIPYGTLANAYNAVAANEIIEAKDMTFVENLTFDRDISFTLMGGYADDYGSRTGFTVLNGILTISAGSMIADGLIIQ